ncbi:MAG: hypothetical protein ACLS5G_09220 [Streptococcus sp.]
MKRDWSRLTRRHRNGTGAEPGSTVVLYNNDDEVGTAAAMSGHDVTPTVKLQTGGVTAKPHHV